MTHDRRYAPQSWVMDIYQPLRGCLCVMPVWCWLVGRVGACLCGCYGAMCVWVDWRLALHVCGASWRDGAMRVPLARSLLGACVPTTGTVVPQSWVIYQPLWGCRCVCQSGGRGRYRLGEIEVFGISFVLLLLQN